MPMATACAYVQIIVTATMTTQRSERQIVARELWLLDNNIQKEGAQHMQ